MHQIDIVARVEHVASKLGITSNAIFEKLPHIQLGYEISGKIDRPIGQYIDHTILKTASTHDQVDILCQEAKEHKFYSVCVNGSRVPQCVESLKGSDVDVAAVIGFPLGAMTTASKVFETAELVDMGASEIDMVLNVGKLLDGDYIYVRDEIAKIAEACKDAKLKVIFETCELTPELIADACILSALGNSHFVKTSTGFGKGGATLDDVRLMKQVVGDFLEVKASGGVRTYPDAVKMIEVGATRIGTSNGIAIVTQSATGGSGY
ncbi:hypothetical protein P9112_002550 [Eukaryota sp. TZLM1-RC]